MVVGEAWVSDFKGMRRLGVRKVQHCRFLSACSIITIESRIHFRSESNPLFNLSDLDDEVAPPPPLEGLKPESQICTQMGTDERSHSPLCCFSNGRWKFFRAMAKARKVKGPELHGKRTFLACWGSNSPSIFYFFCNGHSHPRRRRFVSNDIHAGDPQHQTERKPPSISC